MRVNKVIIVCSVFAAAVVAAVSAIGVDLVAISGLFSGVGDLIDKAVGKSTILANLVAVGVVCSLVFYRRLLLGIALFFMPFIAYASDGVVVDDGGLITMIVGVLPSLVSIMPAWVGVLIGVLYAVAHLVAALPSKFTGSWPKWLKTLINLLAANYGKAKNKDG